MTIITLSIYIKTISEGLMLVSLLLRVEMISLFIYEVMKW